MVCFLYEQKGTGHYIYCLYVRMWCFRWCFKLVISLGYFLAIWQYPAFLHCISPQFFVPINIKVFVKYVALQPTELPAHNGSKCHGKVRLRVSYNLSHGTILQWFTVLLNEPSRLSSIIRALLCPSHFNCPLHFPQPLFRSAELPFLLLPTASALPFADSMDLVRRDAGESDCWKMVTADGTKPV